MIRADALGKPMAAPTMSRVMQQLKGSVFRQMVSLPGFFRLRGGRRAGFPR